MIEKMLHSERWKDNQIISLISGPIPGRDLTQAYGYDGLRQTLPVLIIQKA